MRAIPPASPLLRALLAVLVLCASGCIAFGPTPMEGLDLQMLTRHAAPRYDATTTASLRRAFDALESPSTSSSSSACAGFGAAWAAVATTCPTVKAFAAGNMTQDVFMSTFCSSGCSARVSALFASFADCIPGASVSAVADLTSECDRRPQCYTADVQARIIAVRDACYTPLTNVTNITNAARAAVEQVCSATSDCVGRLTSVAQQYPQCLGTVTNNVSAATFASFVSFLCSKPAGMSETCAWNIRSLGRIDCDSNCKDPNSWCSKSGGDGCSLRANNTVLAQMCTPCLKGLVTYATVLGVDATALGSLIGMYCMQADPTNANSSYCMPLSNDRFGDPSDDGNCNGDYGRCLSRYGRLLATVTIANGASTFAKCLRKSPYGRLARCQADYESTFRYADTLVRTADLTCARNENGTRCYSVAKAVASDACYFAGTVGMCPAGCASSVAKRLATAGCCMPLVNDYLRSASTSFAASYLPTGPQTVTLYNGTVMSFYFTAKYATEGVLDRSQQPANALAQCSNTSALWAQVETPCAPGSGAIRRTLKVRLAWSQMKSDAAKLKKILSSLRSDLANALGTDLSNFKNDSLSEDATTSVTVSSGSSRRQSQKSSGTAYTFSIDGSAAAQSAATFDQQSTSGSIALTSTQATVATDCTTCADTSTTLSAGATTSTAAPTPAPGGSTLPGGYTLPGNSAATGATATAAVLAAVAALAALNL